MTEKQKAIYNGLLKIRPDIAALYKDGIFLRYSELPTRSHAITHYLREIEGGLRDVLDSNKKKDETNKTSILRAFELTEDSELAKSYVILQTRFPALAHRDSSAIRGPRENNEAEKLWDEFEGIVFKLLGSHNVLFDRIDTLIKDGEPTKPVLDRIEIIISDPILEQYFFSNLKQIGWLRPLCKETNVFNPENNPLPQKAENGYMITKWPALNYLKWVSSNMDKLATVRQQDKMWELISTIIDEIATYKKDGERNRNGLTDSFLYDLISTFPSRLLSTKHFEYIRNFVSTGMGGWIDYDYQVIFRDKLISCGDSKNMLNHLNILFAYDLRKSERMALFGEPVTSYTEDISLFRSIYTNIESVVSKIVELCGMSGLKVLFRNLTNRLRDTCYAYISYIGKNRAYEDSEISSIVFTLRDYLLYMADSPHYSKIIKCFLDNKNNIIKRIGYYAVSQRYSILKEVFWNLGYNPFNDGDASYELYQILNNNAGLLTLLEIKQLLEWLDLIEFKPEATPSDIAFTKKQYLSAFNGIENTEISSFLNKCNRDFPHEVSGKDLIPNDGLYGTAAEIKYRDFTANNLAEISSYYIETKKTKDEAHPFRYFNYLAPSIREDMDVNPDKYFFNTSAMITADRDFQKDWLIHLEYYIREHNSYKIPQTLFYTIKNLINDEFFKSYVIYNDERSIYVHIIERILSFFELLLNNNLVSNESMEVVGDILLKIMENKGNDDMIVFDFNLHNYTHTNEYLLFTDLIIYSYNKYRNNPDEGGVSQIIKDTIKTKLDDKTVNPFFYFSLASHFNYLQYIEPDWSRGIVSNTFNNFVPENYHSALTGWLLTRPLDKDMLFYFRDTGAFAYIFSHKDVFTKEIIRQAVNRICFGYINDSIDINDPLIELLINTNDKDIFSFIIMYMSDKKGAIVTFEKIEIFWKKIICQYNGKHSEAYSVFADSSYMLIDNYSLTEEFLDIIEQLAHVPGKHRFYNYIHFILPHLSENPSRVAKIISILIENEEDYVTHRDMGKSVTWLYENDYYKEANEICEAYASKGNQELRDIYKRYKVI